MENLFKSNLFVSMLALWLIQLVNYTAPFFILVHLTKTLGLEIYGILAYSQGIVALSAVFIDFGYSLSATSKISKNRDNKLYVGKIIGGIFAVKLILFFLCSLLVISYVIFNVKYSNQKPVFLLSLIPIFIQGFIPVWFFHGIEKMKFAAISAIASKIILALLVVFLIRFPEDYVLVPVFGGIADALSLLMSVYFIYKLGYKIIFPKLSLVRYCFGFSKHFFASRVAVATYMGSGVVILGLTAQPVMVAVYSMAEQLYKVMQSALGPAAAATYPYMTKKKNAPLMLKLFIGVVIVAACGGIIGYFVVPTLLLIVFDNTWLKAIPVLNVLFFGIVVHAAAIMTGYPLAALVNRLDVANHSVITGSFAFIFLSIGALLLGELSPILLAEIMVISEFIVFIHRSVILVPIAFKKFHPLQPI